MLQRTTRRKFLAQAGAVGVAVPLILPRLAQGRSPNQTLNVGFVAVGGRAEAHTGEAHGMGLNCLCFAEVDKGRWNGVLGKKGWEKATAYTDWRKMFEKHAKDLDVIFVATPDHSHFAPSMSAISMGINCYTEKPLTWSVREAQLLAKAYAKNEKVVTQMGNQGHAQNGWRVAYEFVKGGAVGDVVEFHTWTDRPIWPQGGDRPNWSDPVPDSLDWEREERQAQGLRHLQSLRLARLRRLRFRGLGRHGLPYHGRHLFHYGPGLRRHGRAHLHDGPGHGPVPLRHDDQDDLSCHGRSARLYHLLV
jgi:hypothetical protein